MDGDSPEEAAQPEPLGLIPVGEVVRAERLAQQQAAAALDGKAGNVLGFAGALVALAAVRASWPVPAAALAAALSAWFALVALRIDSQRVILPARARQAWLHSDDTRARLEILDTEVEIILDMESRVTAKSRHVRHARSWLFLAVLTLVLGTLAPGLRTAIREGGELLERVQAPG